MKIYKLTKNISNSKSNTIGSDFNNNGIQNMTISQKKININEDNNKIYNSKNPSQQKQ